MCSKVGISVHAWYHGTLLHVEYELVLSRESSTAQLPVPSIILLIKKSVCSNIMSSSGNGSANGAARSRAGAGREDTSSSPAPKKVRSQPPDVIVAVGSGDKRQEFGCYGAVLSFASKYLDTMLSASMRESETSRIEFPNKDPEEWKMFHTFIDPETSRGAKLTDANVFVLLPWFHEFQMDTFVKECDTYLAKPSYVNGKTRTSEKYCYSTGFWRGELNVLSRAPYGEFRTLDDLRQKRRETFKDIMEFLSIATLYELNQTTEALADALGKIMKYAYDLVDLSVICQLVPLLKQTENSEYGALWRLHKTVASFLPQELMTHELSDVIRSEHINSAIFPHLLLSHIKNKALKAEHGKEMKRSVEEKKCLERKLKSAKDLIRVAITKFPRCLEESMPHKKSMKHAKIDRAARERMKMLIHDHWRGDYDNNKKMNDIGVQVPDGYADTVMWD